MKHGVLFSLLLACPLVAQTPPGRMDPAGPGEARMTSATAGDSIRLEVRLPASYEAGARRYPVVYVLDPGWNLDHATSTTRFLAANSRMPEAIVVGVAVGDRNQAFTPTHFTGAGGLEECGGGPEFLARLVEEVIPSVERAYRTQPFRILAGHSLGGLFAVWAFAERPDLFRGVVALDPSLWWEDGRTARSIAARLRGSGEQTRWLVVAEGNATDEATLLTDGLPPSIRPARVVVQGEDHLSMPLLGLYQGLSRLFADYVPAMRHDSDRARTDALLAQYAELSARYGYVVSPPEAAIREVAQRALNRRDRRDADRAAALLEELYPDSPGALDAAGHTRAEMATLPDVPLPPPSTRVSAAAAAPFLGTWNGILDHEPGRDIPLTLTIGYQGDQLSAKAIAHGVAFGGSDLHYGYLASVVRSDTLELWAQNSGGGYMVSALTVRPDGRLGGVQAPRYMPLPPGAVLPDSRVTIRLERADP